MNELSHVAIIMDGNGRWAQGQGKKRIKGHEAGAKVVKDITTFCVQHPQIKRLTLYAFSTENWKRPKLEVDFLMTLLERHLKNELSVYLENNVRFKPVGNMEAFSPSLQKTILGIQEATAHCDGLTQSLALNYGAQDEIIRAINTLKNSTEEITPEMFKNTLDCKEDVDLLLRTGGDHRLSNFLLWQSAYAEIFFTNTLWPDFTVEEFCEIIDQFTKVERRFGGLK